VFDARALAHPNDLSSLQQWGCGINMTAKLSAMPTAHVGQQLIASGFAAMVSLILVVLDLFRKPLKLDEAG